MNERIKELIKQTVAGTLLEFSTDYVQVTVESETYGQQIVQRIPMEFCEMFAELIINECMIVADLPNDVSGQWDHLLPSEMIAKHFGVE